ncbi:actin cytoskeleton-regulatory complex protein PAN1-like isoform X2 [Pararge aegeria]|uniref:actin cytoskeleton-regulatory complex protein PAN1-like isoform X2 n=1 Tax=Pararge aegeria TaxID=116150 RepID=UPI0019D17C24|nr:actin cytoskeleton-regulatory complex protein PAN1-like isoform X2 [Pararge aegeria]
MSSRTGPNGCQPPLPGQSASTCENEDVTNTENVEKEKDFCRDFIWGQCNKGAQCKYRHELVFEVMKKTLKFCHDFQNSAGCSRELCTYLHATKEEQSLFKSTGQLPRVLAERHANMSAAAAETIPQIALYIQESYAGPPPPPPPPPLPAVSAPASVAPAAAFPRPPVVSVAPIAPRPVMPIGQPPLPPPPPPPPTVPTTSVRQQAPVFTAPPPTAPFTMAHPPPSIPVYDSSKPPPPIMPAHAQIKSSEPTKRKASNDDSNVRIKMKKGEDETIADQLCENCVQRELRIDAIKKQLEAINEEEEYGTLDYKKKIEEYQNLKEILKSLISTDLFQKFVEENVEGIPQNQSNNTIFDEEPSNAGVSTVPNQFLLQLLEYMMGDAKGVDLGAHKNQSNNTMFNPAALASGTPKNQSNNMYNHGALASGTSQNQSNNTMYNQAALASGAHKNQSNNTMFNPAALASGTHKNQSNNTMFNPAASASGTSQNQSNNTMYNHGALASGALKNQSNNTLFNQAALASVTAQQKSFDESLIQALSSLAGESNPVKIKHNNKNNASPEILQTFLDILQQINSTDETAPAEVNTSNNASSNNSNISDSQQYSNRQDIPVSSVSSSRFPPPTAHGVATSPAFLQPQVAPAPPPYQHYQPMPPAGLYYPSPFAGAHTGMQMAQDSQAMRAHVPLVMPPAPPPPVSFAPTAAPAPPPVHQPSHYAMERYPPPYYPRHQ